MLFSWLFGSYSYIKLGTVFFSVFSGFLARLLIVGEETRVGIPSYVRRLCIQIALLLGRVAAGGRGNSGDVLGEYSKN